MSDPVLEIEGLHFSYDGQPVLQGLTMRVETGSVCAFVGRNGAGKTTTFSILAGFLRFQKGAIRIQGTALSEYKHQGRLIGLLPQDAAFFEERSAHSQLLFLARLSGLSSLQAREEVEWALNKVSLQEHKHAKPFELSRGMKVRLGIAQAILGRPPLILLDEPTAGLDPLMRAQFFDLIKAIRGETTLVISSHHLEELEALCDAVCILEKGRAIENGPMLEIKNQGQTLYYTLRDWPFPQETLQNSFMDLSFVFDQNTFTAKPKTPDISLEEQNRRLLRWLTDRNANILEMRRKHSLQEHYLDQLKKTEVPRP